MKSGIIRQQKNAEGRGEGKNERKEGIPEVRKERENTENEN